MISYIDLFGGCGGWSVGLQDAGWINGGLYEIDKQACETARHNFKFPVHCVDLIENREIVFPEVDVVVGSPPCQGFSNEGYKQKDDIRNNLIYSYYEVVKTVRPRIFVFENVPGFQRLYKGHFYHQFMEMFAAIGYKVNAQILDFSEFGVPQSRKRFVAIGCLDGFINPPEPTHGDRNNLFSNYPLVSIWEAISDLPTVEHGERVGIFDYDKEPEHPYQLEMRDGSCKVHNHTTQSHSDRVLEKIANVPVGGNMTSLVGKFSENKTHYEGGYRRAEKDKPSFTAYWTRGMTSIHPVLNRFLSPRECARIQSFPDKHLLKGNTIEHYTQICNAVPPLFARALGLELASKNQMRSL